MLGRSEATTPATAPAALEGSQGEQSPPGTWSGERDVLDLHAWLLLMLLAGTWSWWAWKQGAYFGTVALPGTIVLAAATVILIRSAPFRGRLALSKPARLALFALIALGLWTLASALWSPSPDFAITDAVRVLTYALAFGLGMWLCNLMGRRMYLVSAPLALAGCLVALATAIALLTGHDLVSYLEKDGTLQFPLGYRNANAAFFAIAFWALVGTVCTTAHGRLIRSLAAGGATLCLCLALLGQSRGFQLGMLFSAVVFLYLSRRRAPALGWLVLTAFPASLIISHLDELYDASGHRPPLGAVHDAAVAALCAAGIATVLAIMAGRLGGTLEPSKSRSRRVDALATRGLIVLAVVGVAGSLVAIGDPVSWVDQKVAQFRTDERGGSSPESTRFGLSAASPRKDVWRVAIADTLRDPVFGDGAGGFKYSYLKHRDNGDQSVRDAHSVELEKASELGLPGLALLLTVFITIVVAVLRARRLGPSAASVAAIALAIGAYWLVHASIDWFWPYPAITAPTFALLGAACAPGIRTASVVPVGTGRRAALAGAILLAAIAIPPFLSQRYVNQAYSEWRSNIGRAFSDADRAHDIFPVSAEPLLAKGAIAFAAHDQRVAIDAFTKARRKRPADWTAYYYLARLYATAAPRLARAELAAARELNPREPLLRSLAEHLAPTGTHGKPG
jgi:hypothetical protein